MPPTFQKRVYRLDRFGLDLAFLTCRLPMIVGAYRSQRVAWSLAEKIMLAVTAVNDCRHCARIHGALAQLSGVEAEEVARLLQNEIGTQVDAYERPALQFAQEYAQTEGQPSSANLQALREFYGEAIARDILLYLRLISMGNLSGNTIDALLERLQGRPVAQSRLLDELVIAALAAPVLSLASGLAAWQDRRRHPGSSPSF